MSANDDPETTIIQRIAQEWVKPSTMGLPPYERRYPGHVAIITADDYPMVLVWVERICSGPKSGQLRRVLVEEADL